MKRIIGLAALVGIYSLSSYYLGSTAEHQMKDYLAKEANTLERLGYKASIQNYDRGFFTSRATLVIEDSYASVTATLHSRITHGPILGAQGIGAVALTSEVELAFPDEEVQRYLAKADDYLSIKSRLGFTGNFKQVVQVNPISRASANYEIEFAGASLTIKGNLSEKGVSVTGEAGEISFTDGASKIQMSGAKLNSTFQPASEITQLQNGELVIPSLVFTESTFGQTVTLNNMRLNTAQTLNQDGVDSHVGWHVDLIDGVYPLKDVALDIRLNRVPLSVMDQSQELRGALADSDDVVAELEEKLTALIQPLIDQSELKIDFSLNAFDGDASVNSSIMLVKEPATLAELMENFRDHIRAESRVRLSDKIVQGSPLGMLLQLSYANYFEVENNALVLVAKVDQGAITINGTPLDEHQSTDLDDDSFDHDHDHDQLSSMN